MRTRALSPASRIGYDGSRDDEPNDPQRRHWLVVPAVAALPGAVLSVRLGFATLWYANANAARAHPYLTGYVEATALALGFTLACFLIATVVQGIIRLFQNSRH